MDNPYKSFIITPFTLSGVVVGVIVAAIITSTLFSVKDIKSEPKLSSNGCEYNSDMYAKSATIRTQKGNKHYQYQCQAIDNNNYDWRITKQEVSLYSPQRDEDTCYDSNGRMYQAGAVINETIFGENFQYTCSIIDTSRGIRNFKTHIWKTTTGNV